MYTVLKRTFLAALPLAGLLILPGMAAAHENDHQDRDGRSRNHFSDRHEDYHDGRKDLHREYHQDPSSGRSHQRFHRWLKRDHYDFHNDQLDSSYGRHDRGRHRGWDRGKYRDKEWYAEQPWRDRSWDRGKYRDKEWYAEQPWRGEW